MVESLGKRHCRCLWKSIEAVEVRSGTHEFAVAGRSMANSRVSRFAAVFVAVAAAAAAAVVGANAANRKERW